jgi:hypothetical protein
MITGHGLRSVFLLLAPGSPRRDLGKRVALASGCPATMQDEALPFI